MAQFDADIRLNVQIEKALQGVKKVEAAIQKIANTTIDFGKTDIKNAEKSIQRVKSLTGGLVKAVTGAVDVFAKWKQNILGVAAAFGTIGTFNLLNNFKQTQSAVTQLSTLFSDLSIKASIYGAKIAAAAITHPVLAANIAAVTAGLFVFAPQIETAAKRLLKFAGIAGGAKQPLQELLNVYSKFSGAFDGSFLSTGIPEATALIEAYRKALYEASETVSELQRRQSKLQNTLNQFNSGSATAEKIAQKLVDVNRRLNDELREQADLLRRASGVNVTELEAAKGRKSAETRGRAESFRSNQARENAAVQASLERLEEAERAVNNARLDQRAEQVAIQNEQKLRAENNETIKSLERRAQLEERIANQRSVRIARETNDRAAFLRGNPNQYGEGAVGPQSGRFAAQQAATKQAQQRFAIQSNITKSLAGQTFQYRVQLALLQQAAKVGQQINASTLEQEKIQRRLNRELRVRQGRDLQRRRGEALTNATIGGAFPLLFGQGVGASIGGGLGGGLGGLLGGQAGFAGSLVGTSVGQFFDSLVDGAAELGKALNKSNLDFGKVAEAAGTAGTALEKSINGLEKLEDNVLAAQLATDYLAARIGSDGVNALREFGDASQELSSEFAVAMSIMQSEVAKLFAEVTRGAASRLREFNTFAAGVSSDDPRQRALTQERADLLGRRDRLQGSDVSERRNGDIAAINKRILEIEQEIKDVQKEIIADAEKRLRLATELAIRKENELALDLQSQGTIELRRAALAAEGDERLRITAEAEKSAAVDQFRIEKQELINRAIAGEISFRAVALKLQEKQLDLDELRAQIENRLNKALTRSAKSASAPKSKELTLQRDLVREELRRADIRLQYLKITQGEQAALEAANNYLAERLQKETAILELERQQALENNKVASDAALINQLYDSRKQTLEEQLGLQQAQNNERLRAIKLELDLARIALERQNAGIARGINRDVENAQARIANPFNTEALQQLELQLAQTRRYDDAIRSTAEALEDVNKKLKSNPNDKKLKLEQEALTKRLALYKELLPVLDQVEQKELRQQQIIQKYGFIIDDVSKGLSDAIVGAIKGTETVEQAFARMFESIGKAFIDMATKMLAQQAFLSILGAFAGGGAPRGTPGATSPQGLPYFGPAFAAGGRPDVGRMSLVGENGPELFVPDQRGTIVGANAFDAAKQAMTTSSAVQSSTAALDMEQQQIEALQNPSPIDIRYDSTVINNTTYVTEEQMLESNRRAVKEARARVFSDMRNKPGTRTQLGMA